MNECERKQWNAWNDKSLSRSLRNRSSEGKYLFRALDALNLKLGVIERSAYLQEPYQRGPPRLDLIVDQSFSLKSGSYTADSLLLIIRNKTEAATLIDQEEEKDSITTETQTFQDMIHKIDNYPPQISIPSPSGPFSSKM